MLYRWCCIIGVGYLFSRSPIFSAAQCCEIINLEPSALNCSFCFCVSLCVPLIKPSKLKYTIYFDLLFLRYTGTNRVWEVWSVGKNYFTCNIAIIIISIIIANSRKGCKCREKQVWGIETYCNVFIPCVWSLFLNAICI